MPEAYCSQSDISDEVAHTNVKRFGNPAQGRQGNVLFPTLNSAKVIRVKVSLFCQEFLREAQARPLLADEMYKDQNGVLPMTLADLQNQDARIQDIAISDYVYDATGLVASDGSRWLIAVTERAKR